MPVPVPVVVLFGPTASGKTGILLDLAARKLLFELVSADSMQVYRGMDIGTAKPTAAERELLPHHLVDIRDPGEQFNVGDFVHLADLCCRDMVRRGRLPLVSGGAGFYLKAFIQGLPESPPSDIAIRTALKGELESRGAAALMEELAGADPLSAGRIHLNDHYRLLRALEVYRLTGMPVSSFAVSGAGDGKRREDYRFCVIGLRRGREELYRRIDLRVREMFRQGLEAEVRGLSAAGYGPEDPGMRAIGYREFFTHNLDGSLQAEGESLGGVEALIARNSRRYAKRQITFFASIPGLTWIDASGKSSGLLAEEVLGVIESFLESA